MKRWWEERREGVKGLQLLPLSIPKLSGGGRLEKGVVVEVENEIVSTPRQTNAIGKTPQTLHPAARPDKQEDDTGGKK